MADWKGKWLYIIPLLRSLICWVLLSIFATAQRTYDEWCLMAGLFHIYWTVRNRQLSKCSMCRRWNRNNYSSTPFPASGSVWLLWEENKADIRAKTQSNCQSAGNHMAGLMQDSEHLKWFCCLLLLSEQKKSGIAEGTSLSLTVFFFLKTSLEYKWC